MFSCSVCSSLLCEMLKDAFEWSACYYLNTINLNINHSINFNSHLNHALIQSPTLSFSSWQTLVLAHSYCSWHTVTIASFFFKSIFYVSLVLMFIIPYTHCERENPELWECASGNTILSEQPMNFSTEFLFFFSHSTGALGFDYFICVRSINGIKWNVWMK